MHAMEWLRPGEQDCTQRVYVVHGDEPYLAGESIRKLVAGIFPEGDGAGLSRFNGAHVGLADVMDELRTLPFFSRHRLVIVDDADPFVTKHRKELQSYVEEPSASGTLVLRVKQWPATTNLAKQIAKSGATIECTAPRENTLAPWLIEYAASRHQLKLEKDAAHLLVELVGGEPGILVAEIDKLDVYVAESRKITRADVAQMVGAGRVETIWKALDAATTGDGQGAVEHIDNLLGAGEYPSGLLSAMGVSLLKLHHAGKLRAARLSIEEACKRAGIPPYPSFVEKTRQQHAHLGPARVDELPARLLRADLDLKGGSALEPRVVLEMLLVRLAQPRND
jgi:DNA polymerase III subunit delta